MINKKTISYEAAKNKAENYCIKVERCRQEVIKKLLQWGITSKDCDKIINELVKDRFIDESRYARAFIRDKYRFNGWGRKKIEMSLRMKAVEESDIMEGMEEINQTEYEEILFNLLKNKKKSVKAENDYELRAKLLRFAAGRGFEPSLISKIINTDFQIE